MNLSPPFRFQKSPTNLQKVENTPHQQYTTELNHALDFIGVYSGIQVQNKVNDPCLSVNLGMNFDALTDRPSDKNKKFTNPAYFETQVTGREIVAKNGAMTRFVDLIRVVQDKHKRGYFSPRSSQNLSKISYVSRLVPFSDQESIEDHELIKGFQQNAQRRAESPIEVTPPWGKSSQSPLRETPKKSALNFVDSPEAYLAQSRGLKIDTKMNFQVNGNPESGRYSNGVNNMNSSRISTGNPLPYFQHKFRPDARSLSPTSDNARKMDTSSSRMDSSARKLDFINLVESEIMNVYKSNSALKKSVISSQANSAVVKSPTVTTASSMKKSSGANSPIKGSQEVPYIPAWRKKVVIVDAEKRYRMSRSPKPETRNGRKNETENMKKSVKMLNNMISY